MQYSVAGFPISNAPSYSPAPASRCGNFFSSAASWTASAASYLCKGAKSCVSSCAEGVATVAKTSFHYGKRFIEKSDWLIGSVGNSLFYACAMAFLMRDTVLARLACDEELKHFEVQDMPKIVGYMAETIAYLSLLIFGAEMIGSFFKTYDGAIIGRLRSILMGASSGALLSRNIWSNLFPGKCDNMLISNASAALVLGCLKGLFYNHNVIAIEHQNLLLNDPQRLEALRSSSSSKSLYLLRLTLSVLVSGTTALMIRDTLTLQLNDSAPANFNIGGAVVFSSGAAVELFARLLSRRYANVTFRTLQTRAFITTSILSNRGISGILFYIIPSYNILTTPIINSFAWFFCFWYGLCEALRVINTKALITNYDTLHSPAIALSLSSNNATDQIPDLSLNIDAETDSEKNSHDSPPSKNSSTGNNSPIQDNTIIDSNGFHFIPDEQITIVENKFPRFTFSNSKISEPLLEDNKSRPTHSSCRIL